MAGRCIRGRRFITGTGIRDDNRPENLELWMGRHGPGQRIEDIVRFVVENYREAVVAELNERPQLSLVEMKGV